MPGISERLATQIAGIMKSLRTLPLQKTPGVAESIDWAMALVSLHRAHLDRTALEQTLACVLKVHEDRHVLEAHRRELEPFLEDGDRPLEAGGYGLKTDFGIGSVRLPR